MQVCQITNMVNNKSLIISTPYTIDHEWYYLTKSEESPIYEDIQTYGIDSFQIQELLEEDYDKDKTLKENKAIIKRLEKEYISEFCKYRGSENLYNKISGKIGNSPKSKVHNYEYYYKGKKCNVGYEVYELMKADGYDLSPGVVLAFLHKDGYLSETNKLRYPELYDIIKVIKS